MEGLFVYEIHYLTAKGKLKKTKAYAKDSEDAIRRVKQDEVFPGLYFRLAAFYTVVTILLICAAAFTFYYHFNAH